MSSPRRAASTASSQSTGHEPDFDLNVVAPREGLAAARAPARARPRGRCAAWRLRRGPARARAHDSAALCRLTPGTDLHARGAPGPARSPRRPERREQVEGLQLELPVSGRPRDRSARSASARGSSRASVPFLNASARRSNRIAVARSSASPISASAPSAMRAAGMNCTCWSRPSSAPRRLGDRIAVAAATGEAERLLEQRRTCVHVGRRRGQLAERGQQAGTCSAPRRRA